MADQSGDEMQVGAREAWRRYLALVEPFRPDLARYCRRLTGDVWDAEDLAQDTLLRAFGLLGFAPPRIANLRAYLLRIATNLWIDAERRRLALAAIVADPALAGAASAAPGQAATAQVRDAADALIGGLAPQERAAVVLKDVLELSLGETAAVLGTTVGAVKAALHRGRGRLKDPPPRRRAGPDPAVVDAFIACFSAGDIPGLLALMLDDGAVQMGVVVNEIGRSEFGREGGWFAHSAAAPPPNAALWPQGRSERREFRGEWLAIALTRLWGEYVLTSVSRLETVEGRIARVRCYTFSPDALREIAGELGLKLGPAFYSFPPFQKSWDEMPPEAFR
jgi:RNA polymerase sigma-70 factor (ECF subfamily)